MQRERVLKLCEVWRSDWEVHQSYDQPSALLAELAPLTESGQISPGEAGEIVFAAMRYAASGSEGDRERLERALTAVPGEDDAPDG